ncbi:cytochrome c-type biogenesis protein [Hathewaya proteolytica DSM 3090]|uniref:Cytochrome c-type biogenesis protein n=1 Tax=Hathewaya proteolytica DSM 3090 TaxID=1121331 RepID=A0A1M6SDQ0_9CLOT|nr:cytochrome c biogenesis protein/redoxin [Hathewaya proteolytica]SHK42677.1 cytochrome c-type biogenesis protein [Hathewaya proteolytica DSM 3090]
MMFSIETGVPFLTVFVQGILSFLSPCILPIIPLYVSYFAGGAKIEDENGNIRYPRGKIMMNTFFFVLGISATFFLLGFGFTTIGKFFNNNRIWFARISGIIMILFGLYQFGFFGKSKAFEREHRLNIGMGNKAMGPLTALIMGFTFSFAWTPCVGPILGSVLLMAGSSATATKAFLLICVYTLGFVIPFILVGLFTGTVLEFFKKHVNVVRYTVKIGALLMIVMGIMTLTGFMNNITGYMSQTSDTKPDVEQGTSSSKEENASEGDTSQSEDKKVIEAPDFEFTDQYGKKHKLSNYKGKTVFINFWATWCPPCRGELPDIEALYKEYGGNEKDLVVLGMVAPNLGREGSAEDIKKFLEKNGYTFPVLMDNSGESFSKYGIRAFPTTFIVNTKGQIEGYVESALTADMMKSIVKEAMGTK